MANTTTKFDLTYDGSLNPNPEQRDSKGKAIYPYIPSAELKEAVRLAIALNRPLLLMGDPGCGKTKLVKAIAYEFTIRNRTLLDEMNVSEWPVFEWYVKSNSKAKDGKYIYDAVARLRDAQLINSGVSSQQIQDRLHDEEQTEYIKYGPLGEALKHPLRALLIIDEIDKAEIDFPNDLLLELDEQRFLIDETQTEVPDAPTPPPIVLITSNNERPLPDAFLRRCIFHYVDAPSKAALKEILEKRFGERLPTPLNSQVLESYLEARLATRQAGGKQVGTSEFLDWVEALLLEPETIAEKLAGPLPYQGLLFKTVEELSRYQRRNPNVS